MKKIILGSALLVSALTFNSTAFASHDKAAGNQGFFVYADVVDVVPLVSRETIRTPVTQCTMDDRNNRHSNSRQVSNSMRYGSDDHYDNRNDSRYDNHYDNHYDNRSSSNNRVLPALLGGVLGGAIGHQFGGGDGKRALTILGAITGASIAAGSVDNNRGNEYREDPHDRYQNGKAKGHKQSRTCHTSYSTQQVEYVDGYLVTYRYQGREFQKRADEHPGRKVKVYVSVEPVQKQSLAAL